MKTALALLCVMGALALAAKPPDKPKPVQRQEDRWEKPLTAAAAGADVLLVEAVHERDPAKRRKFELKGAEKIATLWPTLSIDAEHSNFHCMCNGDYLFHFSKAGKQIVTLGYHHGIGLRWHGGAWPGDAALTRPAQEAIPAWFAKQGFDVLKKEREARIAEALEERKVRQRFLDCFPETARKELTAASARNPRDLDKIDGEAGRKAAKAIGKGEDVAAAVFRALGSLPRDEQYWTQSTDLVRRALAAGHTVSGEEFQAGLEKVKDERQALLGAARMYFREGYLDKVPAGKPSDWTVRLAEVALTDGLDYNKSIALDRLQGIKKDPKIAAFLGDVFRGKVGKEVIATGREHHPGEPGIRSGAAIALALQGDTSIKKEVAERLSQVKAPQEVAAMEICLALLGDRKFLKKEHFKCAHSFTLGFAGLAAIERHKDADIMEILIEGALKESYGAATKDEAVRVFNRITGKKLNQAQIETWWLDEGKPDPKRVKPIHKFQANWCVAWSPDGTQIASSHYGEVTLRDAASGKQVHVLKEHKHNVFGISYRHDSKQLATASGDLTVKIWDPATGKAIRTLKGHTNMVHAVAFSPDGKLIASGAESIRIWDAENGKELRTLKGIGREVNALAFSPDGKLLASASGDGTARTWNVKSGEEVAQFKMEPPIYAVAFRPDGRILAGGGSGGVKLWELATRKETGALDKLYPKHLAFQPDGKLLASAEDEQIVFLDSSTGKLLGAFRAHVRDIQRLAFSPDGKRLVSCSWDETAKVWDVAALLNVSGAR